MPELLSFIERKNIKVYKLLVEDFSYAMVFIVSLCADVPGL